MGATHWKLTLSYDGSHFHGWQVQPGLPSVQGLLAGALRSITGEDVLPQGSGRTDAGVHALAQVASCSLHTPIPAENLLRALNRVLPSSIRVIALQPVSAGFHARHSAERKTYEYRIFELRRAGMPERLCSPFLAPYVWACRWPLALDRLQAAAALFCGTHDFSSFAASDPERNTRETAEDGALTAASKPNPKPNTPPNPVKTIWRSRWSREDGLLLYRVTGSGFLHHMVRTLVGTLTEAGRGSLAPTDMPRILAARDRRAAGPTAPARGLFLSSVEYPDAFACGAPVTEAAEQVFPEATR